MPKTDVVSYQDDAGSVPAVEWLSDARKVPRKARAKFGVLIERLGVKGHEMRRPDAAPLRDGIYELRVKHLSVNYRLLYFFHTRPVAKPRRRRRWRRSCRDSRKKTSSRRR